MVFPVASYTNCNPVVCNTAPENPVNCIDRFTYGPSGPLGVVCCMVSVLGFHAQYNPTPVYEFDIPDCEKKNPVESNICTNQLLYHIPDAAGIASAASRLVPRYICILSIHPGESPHVGYTMISKVISPVIPNIFSAIIVTGKCVGHVRPIACNVPVINHPVPFVPSKNNPVSVITGPTPPFNPVNTRPVN